ncbi:hypothetical protein FHS97_002551 [Sphingomonas endophytica]|uniref:HTH merR-type domain-containing protein n=1 Tax=Sphingomonas endophytica TaxID=869719 RepID=A0ABR6N745_9SPHN|nr:hypothetical protein [Sphingomonas endophytica]MBB5726608.1 hypothetical protein [Sphingomonas endophytica]
MTLAQRLRHHERMPPSASIAFAFATFAPDDLQPITGAAPVLIRDWRRRGVIGHDIGGGAAGFPLESVAYLVLLRTLTAHGLKIKAAAASLRAAATDVMLFALDDEAAWATEKAWHAWTLCREHYTPTTRYLACNGTGKVWAIDKLDAACSKAEPAVTVIDLAAVGATLRSRAPRILARLQPTEPPVRTPRVRYEEIRA